MHIDTVSNGGTTLPVLRLDRAPDLGRAETTAELRAVVEARLAEHGGLLIRGLGLPDIDAFHRTVTRFGHPVLASYRGGDTPRSAVAEGVFTSTEYPARFEISLHNEMSYAHAWPSRLFFHCVVAAESGGATPVCDGRALLADLPEAVRERYTGRGVTYRQHLHGGLGLGKSWQSTYETDDRAVVEKFLAEAEAEYEWTAEGGLRVSQHRPGVRPHQDSGEPVWFNQADQWHLSNLPDAEAELMRSVVDRIDDLPHWVTYGDGREIPDRDLDEVRLAMARNKVAVPWRPGDVMVVDNMRMLHGREAFTGARKVVVSMT
ncbi:TauD/TfdA family dioxygenase [Kitasatospora xanthocidica]|uniref:TauD/TfdA family dioxygenase n=1 Tax=Kitasatospora xanthocidica TaxID=83382 RepID=UPI0036EF422A